MTNKLQAAALEIDGYYDALLEDCTSLAEAEQIERRRTADHAALAKHIMGKALNGFQSPGRS